MCGIAGIINLRGAKKRNLQALHWMAQCMKNRGPDDEGYIIASHNDNKVHILTGNDSVPIHDIFPSVMEVTKSYDIAGTVFLGHRRLSIIDLSPYAHQPMCTRDGRYWIVYNGEIYNFKQIRQRLQSEDDIKFISNSDTEVILYAYQKWGPDFLKYLNGMFAFAVWDNHEKTLFCARDRIGIKPFYYTIQDDQFIFASDIKTLIASGIYRPKIDIEGLYYGMSFGVAPRPLTCFKDVKALEQGHWILISRNGKIEKSCYWKIPICSQEHNMKEDEARELLEDSLKNSIKYRLVADVPVGTFMSGGIDSTTVSAIASQLHPGIKAFTLVFSKYKRLDESEQAKATAAMHPMQHIIWDIEIDSVLEHIDDMIECYEEPFYDLSPNYMISKLVAENKITVILNGLGGDELFGGYPYYNWSNRWEALKKSKLLLAIGKHIPAIRHISERLHVIASVESADKFAIAVRCFLTDMEKHSLFLDRGVQDLNTVEYISQLYTGKKEFTDFIEAISFIDIMNYIGNHHVYRVDKFTMRFSIEGRLPFLDHELIELAFRIPSHFKIKNGEQKYVLRRVAERHLHPMCLEAKKKGFDLPTDNWMRRNLKEMVFTKLKSLENKGIFDPKEIWKIYQEWKFRLRSFRSVWELVSVEMWINKFIENGFKAKG